MRAGVLLVLWCLAALVQAAPKFETWQTQNGAKVFYSHAPQLPMVDVIVTFAAGSAYDGQHWGLASMTNALLEGGTAKHDEEQVAEGFNRLGAQFGTSIGRDRASLSLRTLTRQPILDQAVALFSEVLTQPAFPKEVLERVKANTLTGLKVAETRPGTHLNRLFWRTLYGTHPYSHPVSGTLETLPLLTRQQVQDFYRRYYVARNGQIVIAGALSKTQAKALAERIMGQLPAGTPAPALPAPKPLQAAQRAEMPFAATQTYLMMGQLGVRRGDADYYALFLGNHLFGGAGFSSLLMEEVREKRGLVYGVSSYFIPLKVEGPWVIRLSTQHARAEEAEQVVRETLKRFMRQIDPEQLQAIKDNLLGGWPLRFDSNRKIAGYLDMIGFYSLPLDYLERFPEAIQRLTVEDVQAAWRRHIHPDKLLTVRVGAGE